MLLVPSETGETNDVGVNVFRDDFNRSNRGLTGDNGWVVAGPGTINIAAGQVDQTAGGTTWSTNLLQPNDNGDQYGQVTVIAGNTTSIPGVMTRFTATSAYYVFRYYHPNGWELYKQVGGPFNLVGSAAGAAPTPPFKMRLTSIGSRHICSVFSAGVWSHKIDTTDTQYSWGIPGMFTEVIGGVTISVDDYEAAATRMPPRPT